MLCVVALLVLSASMLRGFDISQCIAPVGMETGQIPDRDITASSSFNDVTVGPSNARLNKDIKGGAWCPRNPINTETKEWLEINLHSVHVITGTSIQGRFGNGQGQEYAENYIIEYWRPRLAKWSRYRTSNDQEILHGNVNTYLVSKNIMYPPLWASKIRFIPYNSNSRTVCLRVEVYGCVWTVGIVSYSIYKGDKRSNGIELTDVTYDGVWAADVLKGGLGQLVDGVYGGDEIREAAKSSPWIGWRKDSRPVPFILFEFDKPREFNAVHIFCSNKFMRDVQIFSEATISFSVGGEHFQDNPIQYINVPDKIFENPRNVTINLHRRIGRYVRIEFKYAATWILISETIFDSIVAQGRHIPETLKPTIKPKTKQPPKRLDQANNPEEDPVYVAIIVGTIAVLVILVAGGVAYFVHRQRHRKCFASPVIRTHNRDSYGGCSTSFINNNQSRALPPEVKSDDYQEPYEDSRYHPYGGSVVLEMQEFRDSHDSYAAYTESNYEYAIPDIYPGPPRRRGVSASERLLNPANRLEMEARIADSKIAAAPNSPMSRRRHAVFENLRIRMERIEVPEFPRHRLRMVAKLCEGYYGHLKPMTPTSFEISNQVSRPEPIEDVLKVEQVYIAEADGVPEYGGNVTFDKRVVAVRFFSGSQFAKDRYSKDEFDHDARYLAALCSPNISRVIGLCRSFPFAVVLEYLEHGDLCTYLRNTSPPSPVSMLKIGEQISAGMVYLETINFVHRDLAARNIIIGNNYQVKISDFGTENELFRDDYTEVLGRVSLPLRWAAWETVLNGKYSTKSDVWSFGVLMYELYSLCRCQPFYDMTDDEVLGNLKNMELDANLFVPLSRYAAPHEVYSMMTDCWRRVDGDRPSFVDIHKFFIKKVDRISYTS